MQFQKEMSNLIHNLTYYKNHSLRGIHKNAFPKIRYNQDDVYVF